MVLRTAIPIALLALAAACQGETDAPSAEQNRDMDRAAEMLDKAPDSLSQVDDGGLLAEQEPESGTDSGSGKD